jgi:ectoine hydroxylase-related dioxygenase (phytanoyl-CoA dioxygenase family)
LDIVEQLIGTGVRYNGHKLNMKYPEFGSPVEWHQDWAFYPHTNDDLLAVGVVIDDMTVENGALMILPGSHKGPTLDHHQDGAFIGAVTDPDFTPEGAVPVELKAGGITIHHVRALHGSAPNTSGKPRRLKLAQYCAVDAWPLKGIPDWKTFNDFIIRGEPMNEPRMVAAPVRMPEPYSELKGSIYEVQSLLDDPLYANKGQ